MALLSIVIIIFFSFMFFRIPSLQSKRLSCDNKTVRSKMPITLMLSFLFFLLSQRNQYLDKRKTVQLSWAQLSIRCTSFRHHLKNYVHGSFITAQKYSHICNENFRLPSSNFAKSKTQSLSLSY